MEISREPNPFLHLFPSEKVLALLDEFISSHLHVLIEKVATEDLLSVLVVHEVTGPEEDTEGYLGHELVVLVVEQSVVVVQEHELKW